MHILYDVLVRRLSEIKNWNIFFRCSNCCIR